MIVSICLYKEERERTTPTPYGDASHEMWTYQMLLRSERTVLTPYVDTSYERWQVGRQSVSETGRQAEWRQEGRHPLRQAGLFLGHVDIQLEITFTISFSPCKCEWYHQL